MPLIAAVGIDNNGKTCTFAIGLFKVENQDSYTWFFNQLLEVNKTLNNIKVIMSDGDPALSLTIESQLPHVTFYF